MPEILVTGATGRIGSHVVDVLLAQGQEVRALCLPDDPRIDNLDRRGVEVVQGSLSDRKATLKALGGVTDVFHLGAALTNRGASPPEIFDSIARGTFNITEGIREARATEMRLLFVSSSSVYFSGSPCPFPGVQCDETTPLAPSTPYGAAKLAGELIVEAIARDGLCSAAIVRPSNTADRLELISPGTVFGRRWFIRGAIDWYESSRPGDPDRVSRAVYEQLIEQRDAQLFYLVDQHGLEPELQISDAASVANAMVRIINHTSHGPPDVLNLVADQSWRMSEFVGEVAKLASIREESIAPIESDEVDRGWLFGSKRGGHVPDVMTAVDENRHSNGE